MSLVNLKREYEERRAALIQQLQSNSKLDPATQHQIYGAIKEIENFLRTIDYQLGVEQEKNVQVELERAKPSPLVEKTSKAMTHVAKGTKRVFTEHIPNAAKAVYQKPKNAVTNYFDKRREEARLRAEIEHEMRRRLSSMPAPPSPHGNTPGHQHVILEHPHQELDADGKLAPAQTHPKVEEQHEVRAEPIAPVKVQKVKPSLKAKKGHQHKPHMKKGKVPRFRR